MDLSDDSRQWDYTDPAQRILIAERCRAMLDALATYTDTWMDKPDDVRETIAMTFSELTNARVTLEKAMRWMREQPASTATAAQSITRDTLMKMCPKCGGLGHDPLVYPVDNEAMALAQAPECKVCDGSGEVEDTK